MTNDKVNHRTFISGAALLYGSVITLLLYTNLSALFILMPLACSGFSLMVLSSRAMKGKSISDVRQMIYYNVPFYLLCVVPALLSFFTRSLSVASVIWHLLYLALCTLGHVAPYLATSWPASKPLLRLVVLDRRQ